MEYYGSRGFSELNLVDETDQFFKTGIVTIMGEPDFYRSNYSAKSFIGSALLMKPGIFPGKPNIKFTVYYIDP